MSPLYIARLTLHLNAGGPFLSASVLVWRTGYLFILFIYTTAHLGQQQVGRSVRQRLSLADGIFFYIEQAQNKVSSYHFILIIIFYCMELLTCSMQPVFRFGLLFGYQASPPTYATRVIGGLAWHPTSVGFLYIYIYIYNRLKRR